MKGETFCMHLYLLRHGIAADAQAGESDAARPLTSDGRRKLRKVLKAVAEAKVKPTLMWSSELKRAIQTAEVAKAVLLTRARSCGRKRSRQAPMSSKCGKKSGYIVTKPA